MQQEFPLSLLLLVVAYLLGSIPFGLLLTRMAGVGDIRAIGSGNIGATNVLRTGKKKLAIATLTLDALKGIIPVVLAHWMASGDKTFAASIGLVAILGHVFPVWLRFKGGKGVATAAGVFLALYWPLGLAVAATWLGIFAVSRLSSLSAIAGCLAAPVYAWALLGGVPALIVCLIALLVCYRHKSNILRLWRGEEAGFAKGPPV